MKKLVLIAMLALLAAPVMAQDTGPNDNFPPDSANVNITLTVDPWVEISADPQVDLAVESYTNGEGTDQETVNFTYGSNNTGTITATLTNIPTVYSWDLLNLTTQSGSDAGPASSLSAAIGAGYNQSGSVDVKVTASLSEGISSAVPTLTIEITQ